VRPAVIVAVEIGIENRLHLLDGLEPGAPAFDAEVLVEEVRCRRSTMPLVCGERTRLMRCSMPSSAR
jgi:hypothetical protein